MNIKLNITVRDSEGALVRLLGTIERRGHRLLQLNSRNCPGKAGAREFLLDLDCGGRSPDVLVRQIRRLYDVLNAAWYQCPETRVDDAHLSYEATMPALFGLVVHERGEGSVAPPGVRAAGVEG